MANVKMLFYGTEESKSSEHTLEVVSTYKNEILIDINMDNGSYSFINLDRSTAIRLVRELKKQIGNLKN